MYLNVESRKFWWAPGKIDGRQIHFDGLIFLNDPYKLNFKAFWGKAIYVYEPGHVQGYLSYHFRY